MDDRGHRLAVAGLQGMGGVVRGWMPQRTSSSIHHIESRHSLAFLCVNFVLIGWHECKSLLYLRRRTSKSEPSMLRTPMLAGLFLATTTGLSPGQTTFSTLDLQQFQGSTEFWLTPKQGQRINENALFAQPGIADFLGGKDQMVLMRTRGEKVVSRTAITSRCMGDIQWKARFSSRILSGES